MGTTIEGVTAVAGGWPSRHSALRLAVAAGRSALASSGHTPHEIELLINAGLYRDRNLEEPALAPLIQEDLGLNPEDPHPGGRGTLSFDVANGACGALTALQVADGFLRAGTVTHALVVTSDADPGHGMAPGFPFAPAGGALVCRFTDDEQGLGSFRWVNEPDGGERFRSTLKLVGHRNILAIEYQDVFAARAGGVAAKAAQEVLAEHQLLADGVELVVASPARPEFVGSLATGLGLPAERIVTAGPELHTVAFIAALKEVIRTGALAATRTVLFVAAGAGITAGAALYRPPH